MTLVATVGIAAAFRATLGRVVLAAALAVVPTLSPQASAQETVPSPSDPLFDDTVVQEIRLRIHSSDWEKLRQNYQENTYYPSDFVWAGQTVRNVGIRSRGLGSRSQQKPGLAIDFDRYSTNQEFLGLKSLVLDNLTQDKSGLKERVTMKFFQRLGLPAPREAHARLYINDQYAGLYAVAESVDKRFLKRFEGLDADGFLFEYKWTNEWRFEHRGDALEPYQALFSAQTHEKDAISVLYAPIETLVRIANTSVDFRNEIAEYLDVPAFLKFLAAEAFISEIDGLMGYAGMNNFYLYRTPSRMEFKFIAWDKDNTFHAPDHSVFHQTGNNVLTRRILEFPDYRADYAASVLGAASSADAPTGESTPEAPAPTWLQSEIERQYLLIREAMLSDLAKPYTNDEFEAEVEGLRAFATSRSSLVRAELQTALP